MYIEALAAPDTINTIPEKTLLAFEDYGQVREAMPVDGGDAEEVLAEFIRAGIDPAAIAVELQRECTEPFDKSWNDLMACLRSKTEELRKASKRKGKHGERYNTRDGIAYAADRME